MLRYFAHTFSNKVLHAPTTSLRRAGSESRLEVLDWTRELFNLNSHRIPDTAATDDESASS